MPKNVPFLAKEAIEKATEALLAEFSHARNIVIGPPVPIEDIIEKHLKLGLEFDDLDAVWGLDAKSGVESFHFDTGDPQILGAMVWGDRRIVINEDLDPDVNPSMEGRYRFTLAHEGGHWGLHRRLFSESSGQAPAVVCRLSYAKKPPEEWQADYYASCLLMPREMVLAAWEEIFPDRKQRVLKPEAPINHPFVEVPRITFRCGDEDFFESEDQALDRIARPFAEMFLVSPIAMRIRLENLRLLLRDIPGQRNLAAEF